MPDDVQLTGLEVLQKLSPAARGANPSSRTRTA